MAPAITGLDHTLVGVRDLEAARGVWRRLGFTLTPRGRHVGWGTGNYCIMLADDYVELLGIVDATQDVRGLDTFLAEREGLLGLAFGMAEEGVAQAALDRAGIGSGDVRNLSRPLETPDGTVEPAFRLVHPQRAGGLGVDAFFIRHVTPELMRRPEWLDHANGARRIRAVTAAVQDPIALAPIYRTLAGATSVFLGDGGVTVRLPGAVCHFGAALEGMTGLLGMAIEVGDLQRTADCLSQAGVRFEHAADGITVDPRDATGVVLSFTLG